MGRATEPGFRPWRPWIWAGAIVALLGGALLARHVAVSTAGGEVPGARPASAAASGAPAAEVREGRDGPGGVGAGSNAASVTGLVLDTGGVPVAGALVALVGAQSPALQLRCPCSERSAEAALSPSCRCAARGDLLADELVARERTPGLVLARTDEAGRFRVEHHGPEASRGVLFVSAEGFFPHQEMVARASARAPLERRIVLQRPRRIAGRVIQSGQPAAGAQVEAVPDTSGPCHWSDRGEARSDDAGRFVLEGLACERYRLLARRGGASDELVVDSRDARLAAPDVELVLGASGRLRVRVVSGESGAPLLGCVVEVWGSAGRRVEATDEGAGVFTAERVSPGTQRVDATCPDLGVASGLVSVSTQAEAQLTLRAGVSIKGLVVDAGGRPVAGATVRATQQGLRATPVETITDAAGRFALSRLAAAPYRLEVEHERHPSTALLVDLPVAGELRVALPVAAGLTVSVLDTGGRPLEGAVVTARAIGNEDVPGVGALVGAVTTGEDGRARLFPIEPGRLSLEVVRAGSRSAVVEAAAAAGSEAVLSVTLGEGLSLEGRVVDERGAPVADALVDCVPERIDGPLPDCSAVTDGDGTFALRGLAPGGYALTATVVGLGATRSGRATGAAGTTGVRVVVPGEQAER